MQARKLYSGSGNGHFTSSPFPFLPSRLRFKIQLLAATPVLTTQNTKFPSPDIDAIIGYLFLELLRDYTSLTIPVGTFLAARISDLVSKFTSRNPHDTHSVYAALPLQLLHIIPSTRKTTYEH